MTTGLEAQMKLAGLAVQSMLVGIFIALVCAMVYLLSDRSYGEVKRRGRKPSADRLLLAGLLVLSTMIVGQWICVVIRAFQAFILWDGGTSAAAFYSQITGPSEVARSAFHSATIIIVDLFVIARLYVVYDKQKKVIIGPLVALIALLVACIGTTYAYGAYDQGKAITLDALHQWRIAQSALTISINVYCTALIVWKVGRVQKRAAQYNSGKAGVRSVVTLMAESAAFYTSIVLAAQITYGLGHVSNYFFTDCIPPAAALAAVLVHVRAVLGRGAAASAVRASSSVRRLRDRSSWDARLPVFARPREDEEGRGYAVAGAEEACAEDDARDAKCGGRVEVCVMEASEPRVDVRGGTHCRA
ncbi:hypothetical protein HDZ31DRAFT_43231 [Schizophyllum fasciatum]